MGDPKRRDLTQRRPFPSVGTFRLAAICGALLLISVAEARAQAVPDTIRGTIRTDSGAAIVGAQIIATRAPDRMSLSDTTDAQGRYQIVFAEGTGDYLVHVSALGLRSARRRITRASDERSFVADFKLASGVEQLATVTVSASKPRPSRSSGTFTTEAGEAAALAGGVYGALSPDQQGDLTAIAGTLPGVSITGGGASVFGLGPGQNSVTLGGMAFPGADVPRDARTTVKGSTSTYDPSRGWFTGLQTDVDPAIGSYFSNRQMHVTADAPLLQYPDLIATHLGQRFTGLQLGAGGTGLLDFDKFAYNYGVQAGHRFSDAVSLLNADRADLERAGVSGDSAKRLQTILSGFGLPSTLPRSKTRVTDNASFLVRIDHKPFDYTTFKESRQTWGVIAYGKLSRSTAVGVQPTAAPTHAGETSQIIGSVQGLFSTFLGSSYLTDFRSGMSVTRNKTVPYLRLPEGRVFVNSQFPDTTSATSALFFGGSPVLDSRFSQWTWETTNHTQFYASGHPRHRVNLSADARLDGFSRDAASNLAGSFAYNSLAEVGAGHPTSFTRMLTSPTSRGSEWNAYTAAGDLFKVTQHFQLLYGARLEGNRFLSVPAYNPEIERLFQVRTDHVPNTLHLSPRMGFTWVRNAAHGYGYRVSNLGQFFLGPTAYIRGGIGEFRGFLAPTLLSNAANATGLPNGTRELACYGLDVPVPDWAGYASGATAIPTGCLSGATSALFSDAAPRVQSFDHRYAAPRSWRANLAYSSSVKNITYSVEGTYSLNLNQPGLVDLNLTDVPRFSLSGEGRPVFVSPSSIVASSGVVSPVEARRQSSYGQVLSYNSNLRSRSRWLTVTATPDFNQAVLSISYSIGSTRAIASGFDGSTFTTPWGREWSRGDFDIRHQIQMQAGYQLKRVSLTLFGRLQSGLPYTPLVSSDVNGDGLVNDRAFVFDPALSSMGSIGTEPRALPASAPSRARRCLMRQLGRAAARNSCEGPWTAAVNARLAFDKKLPHSSRTANVGIALVNPLAGVDQLLHGTGNLHAWGSSALPDPVLYNVRGFDAETNRFIYAVNPRFGSTSPASNTFRSPFRITLDVSISLGRPVAAQQVERWLQPGRAGHPGKKFTSAQLKTRYAQNVPDPYERILRESDSLLLDTTQIVALKAAGADYRQRMDSIWTPLADYLAQLGDQIDVDDAVKRQEAATDSAWEASRLDVRASLPRILNPVQLRILPWPAVMLFRATKPLHVRVFMSSPP